MHLPRPLCLKRLHMVQICKTSRSYLRTPSAATTASSSATAAASKQPFRGLGHKLCFNQRLQLATSHKTSEITTRRQLPCSIANMSSCFLMYIIYGVPACKQVQHTGIDGYADNQARSSQLENGLILSKCIVLERQLTESQMAKLN